MSDSSNYTNSPDSDNQIAHYEKWLGEEMAEESQPALTVQGRWRGKNLVWRFEQAGKVHFCHDVKLRRWIFKNLGLYVDVIRRKESESYWKARQGK